MNDERMMKLVTGYAGSRLAGSNHKGAVKTALLYAYWREIVCAVVVMGVIGSFLPQDESSAPEETKAPAADVAPPAYAPAAPSAAADNPDPALLASAAASTAEEAQAQAMQASVPAPAADEPAAAPVAQPAPAGPLTLAADLASGKLLSQPARADGSGRVAIGVTSTYRLATATILSVTCQTADGERSVGTQPTRATPGRSLRVVVQDGSLSAGDTCSLGEVNLPDAGD